MKKLIPRILSLAILVSFLAATFCSLGFCPSMMKMASADESKGVMQQQSSDANAQDKSCPSSNQASDSKDCSCCKCLDTTALLKSDQKSQALTASSDFIKTFTHTASWASQISLTAHLRIFGHSPPKIVFNSTPLYILNKTLRL